MELFHIEDLGAFILWLLKGFKGSFKDCKKGYTALCVGISVVLLFIFILFNI